MPNTTQLNLFFNPASGSFSPDKAEQVQAFFRSAGYRPVAHFPQSAAAAEALVRELSCGSAEPLLVAVGGDGTVNTLLNGLANQQAMLGYVPLGTANVLARELGIRSMADAVARICRGDARPFSAGRAVTGAGSRYFLLMAGIGFDGAVVGDVRSAEKQRFGKGAYLLAAWRQLCDWCPELLTVRTQNSVLSCHTAIVCNAAHYGGNFRLAPAASIFASDFQVVGIGLGSRKSFTKSAIRLILFNSPGHGKAVWIHSASTLRIDGSRPLQLDGDSAGHGPVDISLVPNFARLLV